MFYDSSETKIKQINAADYVLTLVQTTDGLYVVRLNTGRISAETEAMKDLANALAAFDHHYRYCELQVAN